MFKTKLIISLSIFITFLVITSAIKNETRIIEKKILKVNQTSCQTSKRGIYGIGDICNYPGKLKLILTGFAEAAAASHHCYNLVFPDKPLHFEYSTTKGINTSN